LAGFKPWSSWSLSPERLGLVSHWCPVVLSIFENGVLMTLNGNETCLTFFSLLSIFTSFVF
jgi:hypothetical protein